MIGIALPLLLEALNKGAVNIVAPLALAAQNIAIVILSGWFWLTRANTTSDYSDDLNLHRRDSGHGFVIHIWNGTTFKYLDETCKR